MKEKRRDKSFLFKTSSGEDLLIDFFVVRRKARRESRGSFKSIFN